ncbi:MAG: aryl-sulfate sulfotransferase [FCB group bacterium]|jgi:hypothetical protein
MKILKFLVLIIIFLLLNVILKASEPIWNVASLDNPAPGYIVFEMVDSPDFFVIDNYGFEQYIDTISHGSLRLVDFKYMNNGLWIGSAPIANKYYLFNQNMELIDSIPVPIYYTIDYHDIIVLSNGHYLLLCDEYILADLSKIVPGGSKQARIVSNVLVETDRTGKIYWTWRAWDHINITDATPDIDLTQSAIDFTHVNTIVEDKDSNIIVSFRHLDEITKVKKDSSGEIIWRFGGSMCKNNEFTFINDTVNGFSGFSHQHSISLLPDGNLLMFDNGNLKNPPISRAVEYKMDTVAKTAIKVWEYTDPSHIFQDDMGNAERLSNGNTLINWSNIKVTEVKPDNSLAFELGYISDQTIYRVYRLITRMNAVSNSINDIGDYDFNDSNFTTGVTITVSSLTGSGLTSIEKHNYPPPTGEYQDSNFSFIYPYRWVFSQNGISNITGTIKFKLNTIQNLNSPERAAIYKRDKETVGIFKELSTSYDSTTGEITANFTGFGEFTIGSKKTTSVRDVSENYSQKFYFYPNPASVQIQINDKNFEGAKYSIMNIIGITISEGIIENDNINISNLSPGIYFLKAGNKVYKFVKM